MKFIKIISISLGISILIIGIFIGGAFTYFRVIASFETVYAKDFSNDNFDKTKIGMNVSDTYDLIGEPLNVSYVYNNKKLLWYSNSPNDTHYYKKAIVIQNNHVVEILDELYFD